MKLAQDLSLRGVDQPFDQRLMPNALGCGHRDANTQRHGQAGGKKLHRRIKMAAGGVIGDKGNSDGGCGHMLHPFITVADHPAPQTVPTET